MQRVRNNHTSDQVSERQGKASDKHQRCSTHQNKIGDRRDATFRRNRNCIYCPDKRPGMNIVKNLTDVTNETLYRGCGWEMDEVS